MAKAKKANPADDRQDIGIFIKNVWFFLAFFFMMLLIASFGLIAEA